MTASTTETAIYNSPAIGIERAQPSTPTLTETAAVARRTTAARDYLIHVGHEQAQQTRSSPNERNVCSDVNRAATVGTNKCYHLGTDGTANDDKRDHLIHGAQRAIATTKPTASTLVDTLQNKSILLKHRYHSTNTAPRPITNNMRRNSKFRTRSLTP